MKEPTWQNVKYDPINYQDIVYYSAPKKKKSLNSLDEVDPEVRATFDKLGHPARGAEAARRCRGRRGVRQRLGGDDVPREAGQRRDHLLSFSEAVREHPELVKKYLGSVVPYTDNFFATLNSAVFSDGSFVYIPKGVRCPMELSTYFRINAKDTGQFERTLIIAEEGSYVSYLEGCTAPMRDENQLHAAVVELVAHRRRDDQVLDDPELVSGRQGRQGRDLQLRDQARAVRRHAVEDHLDAGRDRFGDHVEVSELHPAGRQLDRRVLLRGDDQQLAAGGHRHQDDPHREEHPQHDRLEGDLRRPRPEHLSRAGARSARTRRTRATTRSAIRC